MDLGTTIACLFGWQVGGMLVIGFCKCIYTGGVMEHSDGWEFVNPYWVHHYNRVNWFGACVVALFYSAICPVGTLCYWFYKLCTVGR